MVRKLKSIVFLSVLLFFIMQSPYPDYQAGVEARTISDGPAGASNASDHTVLPTVNSAVYQTVNTAVYQWAGRPPGWTPGNYPTVKMPRLAKQGNAQGFSASVLQNDTGKFSTTVFTFNDITIFSYFSDTEITIVNEAGDTVYSGSLAENTYYNLSVPSGIYRIFGAKSYTVLVGDAISNMVQGYYAVDQSGLGRSTLLNTYMMGSAFSDERFIVFAYEDRTDFTIKDLKTGALLHAGSLNAGQHFTMPDTPYNTFLQVSANKPVSALSYGDQDYYVPSSNGTFAGTLFLGYSGYIGSWTNSIAVTAYHDDTRVTVTNAETGAIISNYTLSAGQVHTDPITSEVYWKVESSKPVTAANIPYAGWSGYYCYMTRAIDQSGIGSGKLFYVPTIQSRIDVFSFADDNQVTITQLGTMDEYPYPNTKVIFSGRLNDGDVYTFDSLWGQYVYKVEGAKNVSVLQSNGGAGADFMPLSYALALPDLGISSADIQFSPEVKDCAVGDTVTATVSVHNFGPVDASNITVCAYDGDPDGGGKAPVIASRVIDKIAGGGSTSVSFQFTVPENPKFRNIVVKIDPGDTIVESNSSNNKALKPLIPNKDLLPPLAVNIKAPSGLVIENEGLKPNPFTVTANIFNNGAGTAYDVTVELKLMDGLSLSAGKLLTQVEALPANQQLEISWGILADHKVSGSNRYQLLVGASNAELKEVNRAVNVPDNIPPAAPANLKATALGTAGGVHLQWTANTEKDLAGYKIYYGTSSETLDGAGAGQGDSPIVISPFSQFDLTGLKENTTYYFAIKAFDLSSNESGLSNIVSCSGDTTPLTVTSVNPPDNATSVYVTSKITVTFSKEIQKGDTFNNIAVKNNENGKNVYINHNNIRIEGKSLIINRGDNGEWNADTGYTVTIPAGAVKDMAVNALADTYTFSFKTTSTKIILNAQLSEGKVNLSWECAVVWPGFQIYRLSEGIKYSLVDTIAGNSFVDNYVKPDSDYYYYVIGRDNTGKSSQQSNTVHVKIPQEKELPDVEKPTPPSNLKGYFSEGNVHLTWNPSKDISPVSYNIYLNGQEFQHTTQTSTQIKIGANNLNKELTFYVRAKDAAGNTSEKSNSAIVFTKPPQQQVTLKISDITPKSLAKGQSFTIVGTGFIAPVTVSIGETAALNVHAADETKITARVPDNIIAGTYDVTVNNANGKTITKSDGITISSNIKNSYNLGGIIIKADKFTEIDESKVKATGNIRIGDYLRVQGTLVIDTKRLEAAGDGKVYVDTSLGLTVYLIEGDFKLDTNLASIANKGLSRIKIAGLKIEVNKLKLLSDGIEVVGKLIFSKPLDKVLKDLSIDQLNVQKSGIKLKGDLTLPEFQLKGIGFKNGKLKFNTFEDAFGGSAALGFPKLFDLLGGIGIKKGQLDEVSLGLSGLNTSIDTTGLFLNRVQGSVSNLSSDVTVGLDVGLSGGPKIGENALISADPLGGSLTPHQAKVEAHGTVAIINKNLSKIIGKALFEGLKRKMDTKGDLDVVGILKGYVSCSVAPGNFEGQGNLSVKPRGLIEKMPDSVVKKWILDRIKGDPELTSGEVSIDKSKIKAEYNLFDNKLNLIVTYIWGEWFPKLEANLHIWPFKKSLHASASRLLALESLNEVGNLQAEISSQHEEVFFFIEWQSDNVQYNLVSPSGRVISPNESQPQEDILFIPPNQEKVSVFIIDNPEIGTWRLEVPAEYQNEFNFTAMVPSPKPVIEVTAKEVDNDQVKISWTAKSYGGSVNLYYDTDNEITDGVLIAENLDLQGEYLWNHSGLANGSYYIYAKLDDGYHVPSTDYSDNPFVINNKMDVGKVQGLTAGIKNGNVNLSWTPVDNQDLHGYILYWLDESSGVTREMTLDKTTEYTVDFLEYGKPYQLSISAYNALLEEGESSDPVRLTVPAPTPPWLVVHFSDNRDLTNDDKLEINGSVAPNALVAVTLDDAKVVEGITGDFIQIIDLHEGWNELKIIAEDPEGDINQVTKTIFADTIAPQLELGVLYDGAVVNEDIYKIFGWTEVGTTLRIAGENISVEGNGYFSKDVKLSSGQNKIDLLVTDVAGNQTGYSGVIHYLKQEGEGGGGGGEIIPEPNAAELAPLMDATGIQVDAEVSATFYIDVEKVDLTAVTIKDSSGTPAGRVSASLEGRKLTITHDKFAYNTKYTVTIPENAVKSKQGGIHNKVISWSFTTEKHDMKQAPEKLPFTDLQQSYWAWRDIKKIFELKISSGYPDNTFRPENRITRAEFTMMLIKALGIPEHTTGNPMFDDVPDTAWYYGCVQAAAKAGIVKGYEGNEFRPDNNITRQEITSMLIRALGREKEAAAREGAQPDYADADQIALWAKGCVAMAKELRLISGYPDNTFRPLKNATRAEACAMLNHFLDIKKY